MEFLRKVFNSELTPKQAIRNLQTHLDNLVLLSEKLTNASLSEEELEHIDETRNLVAGDLSQIRFMLLGDTEIVPNKKHCEKLVKKLLGVEDKASSNQSTFSDTLVMKMLTHAKLLNADGQKEITLIVNYLMRIQKPVFKQASQHNYTVLVQQLLTDYGNYERPRLQIQTSSILQEMVNDEEIHAFLLLQCPELMTLLLQNAKTPNFDLAETAFTTLEALLRLKKPPPEETVNRETVVKFFDENYTSFTNECNILLTSDSQDFATLRQSLKLLASILWERDYKDVFTMRFIADKYNLQHVMNLLKHESRDIVQAAFDVFAAFVVNERRSPGVYKTLYKNRDKLVQFLEDLAPVKETDPRGDLLVQKLPRRHYSPSRNSLALPQFVHEKLIPRLQAMTKTAEEYEAAWKSKTNVTAM